MNKNKLSAIATAILCIASLATTYAAVNIEAVAAEPSIVVQAQAELAEETQTPQQESPDEPQPPEQNEPTAEAIMLAKTVWGEARGCGEGAAEWALVAWCAFQRVDSGKDAEYGATLEEVLGKTSAFHGYNPENPVDPEILAVCIAEIAKWQSGAAAPTHPIYAPTAPYYFFHGDGTHNYFREEWR